MEVVGGEYEIHLSAGAGGGGEAGEGGDVGVKEGAGGGGDEADKGVVTAVAVAPEAAGDGVCSMGEEEVEGVIGGDGSRGRVGGAAREAVGERRGVEVGEGDAVVLEPRVRAIPYRYRIY